MQTRIATMQEVFSKRAEQERLLRWKHKGFDLVYNWVMAVSMLTILILLAVWAVQIHIDRKASGLVAVAMADYQAEQQADIDRQEAAALAQRQTEEYRMQQEAAAVAKAFYGIRNFVDRYGYSAKDFETYARCMFNRADAGSGRLSEVIAQEGQFLAYSDNNPVLDEYYDMALSFVREWHEETTKPVDTSYQFAELTPQGIYLTNVFNADGYARRWRAA